MGPIPKLAFNRTVDKLANRAARVNRNDPDAFDPFMQQAMNETMDELGLAGSQLEYSSDRYNPNYEYQFGKAGHGFWSPTKWFGNWGGKPSYAVTHFPPEHTIANDRRLQKKGGIDVAGVMEYVMVDFQKELDKWSKVRFPDSPPQWKAGHNAATRYSSVKTGQHGVASYEVVLIHDNGTNTENLEEIGQFEGNNVIFTLEASILRYIKDNEALWAQQNVATQRSRLFNQNNPSIHGGIGMQMIPLHQRVQMLPGVNEDLSMKDDE